MQYREVEIIGKTRLGVNETETYGTDPLKF